MRLYLAAPWIDREKMEEHAKRFELAGHTITHRWWHTEDIPEEDRTIELLREQAEKDLHGVQEADAVVLFNTSKSEGKAVEQGIAIALGLDIIAIGSRGQLSKNVFHYLLNYSWVSSVEEAIDACRSN